MSEYDLERLELADKKILEVLIVLLSCLQYSFGKVHSMRVLFEAEEKLEISFSDRLLIQP